MRDPHPRARGCRRHRLSLRGPQALWARARHGRRSQCRDVESDALSVVRRLSQEPADAPGDGEIHPPAQHPHAVGGAGSAAAVGRQPAEGRGREMAQSRLRYLVLRRADPRHRRRRQERDLQALEDVGGPGQGNRDDFLRADGDPAHERPHRGDVRGPHHRRTNAGAGDAGTDHGARHATRNGKGSLTMTKATTTQKSAATAPRLGALLAPAALQKLLAFASLVLLLIYFSFASPAFMQTDNMINILQATAVNGVLAIASTFVIITAGIDLSVGTLMTFCAVVAGVFLTYWELPMWTGIVAAIAAGALCGGVSGTLIAKMKIPPFIATLGMMQVLKGLSLVVSGDKPIYFSNTENFSMISQDSLLGNVMPRLPIPNAVLILFVVAILAAVVLNRTSLGRYTFAIGSNEEAVRLSGVSVDRWKIIIYGLGGAICGVAGLLLASRINSAQPALGQGYELDAIAAVVIGGASLRGVTETILCTLFGACIMSVLTNGLRIK